MVWADCSHDGISSGVRLALSAASAVLGGVAVAVGWGEGVSSAIDVAACEEAGVEADKEAGVAMVEASVEAGVAVDARW